MGRQIEAQPVVLPEKREAGRRLSYCPICNHHPLSYMFLTNGIRIEGCQACGLLLQNPQPDDLERAQMYSESYFLGAGDPVMERETEILKGCTAELYLDRIERYRGQRGGRLLEVGCGTGAFVRKALERGYDVVGLEYSRAAADRINSIIGQPVVTVGALEQCGLGAASFDVCVLSDVLEHLGDPVAALEAIYNLLKPGGVVFISTPSTDSWSARWMRRNWAEFKREHLFYFNTNTATSVLFRCGFEDMLPLKGRKVLSFRYVHEHFRRFPVRVVTGILTLISRLLPAILAQRHFSIVASGIDVLARRPSVGLQGGRRKKLSVIVPVYNEKATFGELMRRLLAKNVEGLDVEIIVVESGSTDGTREEARRYSEHPGVTLVLQDRPRGKGNAVRAALAKCSGDFILIQDADLEYELNDYDALLEPLMKYRFPYVLGSRHTSTSGWKIRRFGRRSLVGFPMNAAHILLTVFFNLLYGQSVRDPFTMFKVFRRDCISRMRLECDRFDFDCELVAKLARRGYRPLEVPVNYQSRSFAEGKKIRFFRDPPTYVKAFLKYRFVDVDAGQ